MLDLADVYAAIAYYLRHREEMDTYLRRREEKANKLQEMIEANQKPGPSREELESRARAARILSEMCENSIVLPPGFPTTTEMIREDRDR